jgi:hypothetical protein
MVTRLKLHYQDNGDSTFNSPPLWDYGDSALNYCCKQRTYYLTLSQRGEELNALSSLSWTG